MRGKSNLIYFFVKITHLVDQGKLVGVIFLDFSKAFDSVSQHPMQNVQHTARQKHSMVAYNSGSKGYSQCDYIVQADSH